MSEEQKPIDTPQEPQDNTPVQPTAVEQEALDQGWVPKEEFNGEEHKWVDAAEFLRRGELFKKIDLQNREMKELRRALVEIKKHAKDVREHEYDRALATLKKEKKQALEDGDADAVIAVDEQIDLVKEQQKLNQSVVVEEMEEPSGAQHPEFVAWTSRNQWYVDNTPMRAFADAIGQDLSRRGVPPSEVLKRVEAEVKKEFPNKFRNPNQDRRSGVESPTSRSGSKSSTYSLTPQERAVMNTFVRTGVMTEAEYIQDLKKIKGDE